VSAVTSEVSMNILFFKLNFIGCFMVVCDKRVKKFQLILSEKKKNTAASYFSHIPWLQKLAYCANICNKLNKFNLSMQGCSTTVLTAEYKVIAVKLKLKLGTIMCNEINMIVSLPCM
jgi:hypothetical protein